jgi:hypothetical protein
MGINYGTYAVPRLDLGMAFEEYSTSLADFIAPKVLPTFRSNRKSATYSALTAKDIIQDNDAARAPGGNYNRISTKLSDKSFDCEEYGFEHVVDDLERQIFSSDFDAEMVATKITARALALQREKRAAALLFNTTTWTGASLFLDITTTWATIATSTPVVDISNAAKKVKDNCGIWPNALITNYTNLTFLLQSTTLRNQFPGHPNLTWDMLTSMLGSMCGIRKVIIAGAIRDSADEGLTAVKAQVWSDSYAMVAVVPEENAPLLEPAVGRSFLYVPDSPAEVNIETYREEQKRSTIVRARHNMDEVVHDANFAFLLKVD